MSLQCFSLQLLAIEVNLFIHCRRSNALLGGSHVKYAVFGNMACLGKARLMHPDMVWNVRFKNNNLIFGLSERWLKVIRMEGNSQAAIGQAMIILHRNHTARDFVIRTHSVLLLFSSVSHFFLYDKVSSL